MFSFTCKVVGAVQLQLLCAFCDVIILLDAALFTTEITFPLHVFDASERFMHDKRNELLPGGKALVVFLL